MDELNVDRLSTPAAVECVSLSWSNDGQTLFAGQPLSVFFGVFGNALPTELPGQLSWKGFERSTGKPQTNVVHNAKYTVPVEVTV